MPASFRWLNVLSGVLLALGEGAAVTRDAGVVGRTARGRVAHTVEAALAVGARTAAIALAWRVGARDAAWDVAARRLLAVLVAVPVLLAVLGGGQGRAQPRHFSPTDNSRRDHPGNTGPSQETAPVTDQGVIFQYLRRSLAQHLDAPFAENAETLDGSRAGHGPAPQGQAGKPFPTVRLTPSSG